MAPPANDNIANAQVLANGTTQVTGDTTEATVETNEARLSSDSTSVDTTRASHTVWFKWYAPSSSNATVTTVGSAFDTYLSIFTSIFSNPTAAAPSGTFTHLTPLASNDDGGGGTASSVTFTPTSGETYWIQLSGWDSSKFGAYTLNYPSPAAASGAPANDNLANATTLASGTTQVTGSTTLATKQVGEYGINDNGTQRTTIGRTVWFRWTAPSSGSATITTVGSSFDTILSIFKAKAGVSDPVTVLTDLDDVVGNDDGGGGGTSSATFTASAGTVYYVQIAGFGVNDRGNYVLNYPSPAASGGAVTGVAVANLGGLTATSTGIRAVVGSGVAPLGGLAATASGAGVTPGVPTAHTNQTPNNTDVNNTAPIETGVRLTADTAATVAAIVWWVPDTNIGTYTAQLWRTDTSDDVLGEGTGTLLTETEIDAADVAPGWSRAPITPQALTPGVLYTAAVHASSGHYVATSGAFSSAQIAGGGITLVQSGTDPVGIGTARNGVFIESASPAYPDNAFGSADYFVDVELGDPPNTGQGAADLGGLTATATGQRTVAGQAAASLGAATATATGARTTAGQATATLGGLSGTATGTRRTTGTAVAALGALAGTAAGTRHTAGTAAAPLGTLTGTAAGQRTAAGTAAAPLGALTATATGSVVGSGEGTGNALLGGLAATATGRRATSGIAAASLGDLMAAAAGARRITGTAQATLGAVTSTAVGQRQVVGTAAAALGAVTATASGDTTVTGQAAAPLGGLVATASGTGIGAAAGVGAANLGALTTSAVGSRTVRAVAVANLGGLAANGNGPVVVQLVTTGRNRASGRVGRSRAGGRSSRNQAGHR